MFERHGFGVPAQRAMTSEHLQIIRFTVLVALAATALMLPPGVALAWLLARGRFPGKTLLETVVTLPLVLPPVATGFILLRLLGRRGPFGAMLERGGVDLIFTWKAVLLAMAVMGLPLVVRTARAGFEQITRRYEQMAETLGAGPWRVFFTISLPLASRTVLAGALLGFSRALGEFGATIVIAGNIPGETRTIAVAMFGYLETGRDSDAAWLLLASLVISFASVWLSNRLAQPARTPPAVPTPRGAALRAGAADERAGPHRPRLHARAGRLRARDRSPRRQPRPRALRTVRVRQDDVPGGDRGAACARRAAGSRSPDVSCTPRTARLNLPPRLRGVGYVPQDALLFPHLDVRGNVLFGARRTRAHGHGQPCRSRGGARDRGGGVAAGPARCRGSRAGSGSASRWRVR